MSYRVNGEKERKKLCNDDENNAAVTSVGIRNSHRSWKWLTEKKPNS